MFLDVRFVLFLSCLPMCKCLSSSPRSIAGVLFDSVGILRTTSYCTPLACDPALIGVLAAWRRGDGSEKNKTGQKKMFTLQSRLCGPNFSLLVSNSVQV